MRLVAFVAALILFALAPAACEAARQHAVVQCRSFNASGSVDHTSGVIILDNGTTAIVATAGHLIDGGSRSIVIDVPDTHPQPYRAKIIARGRYPLDSALLEFRHSIPVESCELEPAAMPGDLRVDVMGYPGGQRLLDLRGGPVDAKRYQTATRSITIAGVRSGHSGGPVFYGDKVIGTIWGATPRQAFYVPASQIIKLMQTKSVAFAQYRGGCFYGNCPPQPAFRSQSRIVKVEPALPFRRQSSRNADALAGATMQQGQTLAALSQQVADLRNQVADLRSREPIPGPTGPRGIEGRRGEPGPLSVVEPRGKPIVVNNYDRTGKLIGSQAYPAGTPIRLQHGVPNSN